MCSSLLSSARWWLLASMVYCPSYGQKAAKTTKPLKAKINLAFVAGVLISNSSNTTTANASFTQTNRSQTELTDERR